LYRPTSEDACDGRGVEQYSLTKFVLYGGTTDELTDSKDDQYDKERQADEL